MRNRRMICMLLCLFCAVFCGCHAMPATLSETLPPRPVHSAEPATTTVVWCLPDAQVSAQQLAQFNTLLQTYAPDLELEIESIATENYAAQMQARLQSDTHIDLFCGSKADIARYGTDFLMPLSPYLHGEGYLLWQSRAEWIWQSARYEEELYGVPAIESYAQQMTLALRTEDLSQEDIAAVAQLPYADSAAELLQQLTPIAQRYRANNAYTVMQPLSLEQLLQWGYVAIGPGICVQKGVSADAQVISLYESEWFAQWCVAVRDWYAAGYYPLTPISGGDETNAVFAMQLLDSPPQDDSRMLLEVMPSQNNAELVGQHMVFLSANSQHALAAIRLLQLLNTHAELAQALCYAPNNTTATVSPVWLGNAAWDAQLDTAASEAMLKQARAAQAPFFLADFVFDETAVQAQCAAVRKVIAQYEKRLIYGVMKAQEETLQRMQEALNAAGLADIRTEAQKQLTAYLGK